MDNGFLVLLFGSKSGFQHHYNTLSHQFGAKGDSYTKTVQTVHAQNATKPAPTPSNPADQSTSNPQSSPTSPQSKAGLERVLSQMDKAASNFRTAEADFVWDQYQKVVNEHDIQKGKVYFRRQGQEIQMAADITEPAKKTLLFSGGKVQVYQAGINQITEYNVAKNRQELESFLVLGFGGSGRRACSRERSPQHTGVEKSCGDLSLQK